MQIPPDNPRRLRLRVAFKLLLVAGALATAVVVFGYLGGGPPPLPEVRRVELGGLSPGEARRLDWDGRPVIVLRREDAATAWFVAFASAGATGCPVAWEPARRQFADPCSGARYDDRGRPVDAPALAPLRVPPHHFDGAGRLLLGRE